MNKDSCYVLAKLSQIGLKLVLFFICVLNGHEQLELIYLQNFIEVFIELY